MVKEVDFSLVGDVDFQMKNCMNGYYSIIFTSAEFVINTSQDGKDRSFKNLIFYHVVSQRGPISLIFFLAGALLPVFILYFLSE